MQGLGRYDTMRETDRQIGREGKREDRKTGRQMYMVECSEGGSPLRQCQFDFLSHYFV